MKIEKSKSWPWEQEFMLPTDLHAKEFKREVTSISRGWEIGDCATGDIEQAFPETVGDARVKVKVFAKSKGPLYFASGLSRGMWNFYANYKDVNGVHWRSLPQTDKY